jgi:hypothetical protein
MKKRKKRKIKNKAQGNPKDSQFGGNMSRI